MRFQAVIVYTTTTPPPPYIQNILFYVYGTVESITTKYGILYSKIREFQLSYSCIDEYNCQKYAHILHI